MDALAWRQEVPEIFYPASLIPGLRELGQWPLHTWGGVYPRTGWTTQAEEPKAAAINAQRAGDIVTLDLQVQDLSAAFSTRFGRIADAYISGIKFYSFTGLTDPGRGVGAWTLLRTEPYVGGLTSAIGVDIDCTNIANDVFLAAGVEMTGEYSTVHLGASTIVECDPTLADPDDKFDLIRERGNGHKKGKPFQR